MKPFDLNHVRAKKARLGHVIGVGGYWLLITLAASGVLLSLVPVLQGSGIAFISLSFSVLALLPAIWWRCDLKHIPVSGTDIVERLDSKTLGVLPRKKDLTALELYSAIKQSPQALFVVRRLLMSDLFVEHAVTDHPTAGDAVLNMAAKVADACNDAAIEPGHIMVALLNTNPLLREHLRTLKLDETDVEELALWLQREILHMRQPRVTYGGVGRDWVFGFTPILDRFGSNISLTISRHKIQFGNRKKQPEVQALIAALSSNVAGIALIGQDGVGKSSAVHAAAAELITGHGAKNLAYHQIISLEPSAILSASQGSNDIEHIMVSIAHEIANAGHVILFLDDAALFTHSGTGAFNATQLLQQLIQNRTVPIIAAFSPADYERLKATEPGFANLLTPIHVTEPDEITTKRIMMDHVLRLENLHKVLITYGAIDEAYRLSGRYNQDEAYPGKALKLLEQAATADSDSIVSPQSVQQVIEQIYGVKASTASPAEATALLQLEDRIHERMIGQSHAVSVVSAALRRARAGIANPNRPIGSFLFLGPTGVGKTELAKAIASIYFGDANSLIRLDMSEYQQSEDVRRLLAANDHDNSLLMQVRQRPFSVVLLDEIEKAHPNILNLLLQLLDEGRLTDDASRPVSFKDAIVIATSNAGAQTIHQKVSAGESLDSFKDSFVDALIAGNQFKPELLNRFDELVLFGPLDKDALAQIVRLMLAEINQTLTTQKLRIDLTPAALQAVVIKGYDPRLGARPLRRALQHAVEDPISKLILSGQTQPGQTITLDQADLSL